ncbi:MAG: rhodanese [Desulfovibrionaceae bacterium]|nr:MAG: rhodanese [Desulfovibrionaceae bacterium]
MLSAIPPQRVFDMFRNGEIRLIDIRESSEYAEKFIPGARLVPLSAIDGQDLKDASSPDKPVVFFCRSGKRTDKNAERLERLAGNVDAFQMEGGMTAWEKEGLPVKLGNAPFPLFRQIQIGAGVLVLSGILGSYVWHPMYWLSAFVGAGLIFAGITGFCGLGILLSRMPWNRR